MRSWIAAALTVAAVVGLGYVHPFGDPRAEPAKGPGTLLQTANMPAEAKVVLVTKCADCHSSETRWPVYARIAAGSWLIERDIIEARKKMDLSQWGKMPADKREVLMAKIFDEAKSGDMPPLQYRLLHRDARLSKANMQALSMLGKSASGSEATLAVEGNAAQRKAVFEKRCTGCHAMDVDREGAEVVRSVWEKGWERAGVYVLNGIEKLECDMERCDAGEVAERSGFDGAGQQYELQRPKGRRAPELDCLLEAAIG
jgi:cytochrome c